MFLLTKKVNFHFCYFRSILVYNNYKFLGIGDFNHSFLGIYGPGSNFLPQKNFARFWDQDSSLDLLVSAVDTPMVANEGVTFNWLRRQFIFCGGQQVQSLFQI